MHTTSGKLRVRRSGLSEPKNPWSGIHDQTRGGCLKLGTVAKVKADNAPAAYIPKSRWRVGSSKPMAERNTKLTPKDWILSTVSAPSSTWRRCGTGRETPREF